MTLFNNHLFKASFCLLIFITACDLIEVSPMDRDEMQIRLDRLDKNNYFPLEEGNFWKLRGLQPKKIGPMVTVNGHEYFQWTGTMGIFGGDTILIREDEGGKIYTYWGRGIEELEFDLSAEVGDSWQWAYQRPENLNENSYVSLESKTDTIQLGDHTFYNCYRFRYHFVSYADLDYDTYFVPGIGLVGENYNGDTERLLESALVNGQHLNFK